MTQDFDPHPSSAPHRAPAPALPLVWCLLSAALFGASTPASKLLLGSIGPIVLSGLLYLGGALAVAPWALRQRAALGAIDRRNWLYLLGAVIAGGVLGPALLLTGLSLAPAGSVSLWLTLETVSTALLARVFFREHLHVQTWIAVGLVVAASALLSWATPGGGSAVAFVALACLAWGFDNNFTASIDRFSPSQITFAKGLVAGTVNTTAGLLLAPAVLRTSDVCLALSVGALAYGVSILLYIRGAQQLGATRSQLVFSTAPAFGLALSAVLVGESLTWIHAASAALMAAAIWLWHREHHAHSHRHEPLQHNHAHRHDDGHHGHSHAAGVDADAWHSHEHTHDADHHSHSHRPDLHHRHHH